MSLELIGISKTFNGDPSEESVEVLRDVCFRIEDNEFISIIGPSGCGKTTLLSIIAGLEKASEGRVLLDRKEIKEPHEQIGFVFQEYALFPWRSTLRNLEFGLEIKGISKAERENAALAYIKAFGLSGFENKYPKELSGGMKQRAAIARTLITNPKVVLMDEPFGSLDSQTRNTLQEFLLGVWRKRKEIVLFVTHNVDEAVFLSDRIIVFSGRPGAITNVFDVPCPRPRDRTSQDCNKIRKEILFFLANANRKSLINEDCCMYKRSF